MCVVYLISMLSFTLTTYHRPIFLWPKLVTENEDEESLIDPELPKQRITYSFIRLYYICLKITLEDSICNTAVFAACVFFVNCTKLWWRWWLFSKNSSGNWHNFFLAIGGVFQKSWAPRIASDCSTCNENGCCCELAGQVMKQVIALKSTVKNVARNLNNFLVGMTCL